MAIIGGGEKMLTRAAFNDALGYNKLTDDTKVVKIEDIYSFVGENNKFVYGDYEYMVDLPTEQCSSCGYMYDQAQPSNENGSSWNCNICGYTNAPSGRISRCLRCQDVSVSKWENDPTWRMNVSFGGVSFEPTSLNKIPTAWEKQGGGLYSASESIIFKAYDGSGNKIYSESVDVYVEGQAYTSTNLTEIQGSLSSDISFTFKKSNPPTTLALEINAFAVVASISQGSSKNVNPTTSTTNVQWGNICFKLKY